MNPTDTPNACPHCGMAIYSLPCAGDETTYWKCGTDFVEEWGFARSAECYEKELAASKAEVERLKKLLSDLLILTEKNYWNSTNYNQIKEALTTEK